MKQQLSKRKAVFWLASISAVIVLILLSMISGWIVEWLWMRRMGFENIFWRLLSIKWALFALSSLFAFFYLWINFRFAAKKSLDLQANTPGGGGDLYTESGIRVSARGLKAIALILSLLVALIFGLVFYPEWDSYLRFHWGSAFGEVDPIFGRDIGFYLFRLPFYELIQNGLTGLTLITLLIVSVVYGYFGVFRLGQKDYPPRNWTVIRHVSVLFLFLIGVWAWGYYLDRFELLYSTRGVVYGVGYTAHHVTRISLWVMLFASVALGALLVINLFMNRFRTILIGVGSYLVLYFVLIVVLPGLVQKFTVQPSEL
jgi:uncharacterized membrane protein (UPF0182 family)